MKKLFFILFFILALASVSFAGDSPHSNDVVCDYCHAVGGTGIAPSPFWGGSYAPSNLEDTTMNQLCLGCHSDATGGSLSPTSAIQVRTHTSRATSTTYGDWTVECVACHNPHYQRQYLYYRNLAPMKLAQGTVTTIVSNGMVGGVPQSTITYSGLTGKAGWTTPTAWFNKSSSDRGAIIYPDATNISYSFNILSADATTIIVRGDVTAGITAGALGVGKTFMITYGQAIKDTIYAPGKTDASHLQRAYDRDSKISKVS